MFGSVNQHIVVLGAELSVGGKSGNGVIKSRDNDANEGEEAVLLVLVSRSMLIRLYVFLKYESCSAKKL